VTKNDLHEVVDFIATLPASDGRRVWERVAEKYPLDREEFLEAAQMPRAEHRKLEREAASLDLLAQIARRYGFGEDNLTLGEAMRRAAEAGDSKRPPRSPR
jgi:hypothetical protein